MGTGGDQPAPYMPNPAAHPDAQMQSAANGSYGTGPPSGFTGMASPYYQQSGAGKSPDSGRSFNWTIGCRIVALLLSILALALIASAKQSEEGYVTSTLYVWLNRKVLRTKSGKFSVAMSAIVLTYEVVQIVLSCLHRSRAISFMASHGVLLATSIADQVLAYIVLAADASLSDQTTAWRTVKDADGNVSCDGWNSYCSIIEAGLVMGYLAFFALAALATISVVRYIKLSSRT